MKKMLLYTFKMITLKYRKILLSVRKYRKHGFIFQEGFKAVSSSPFGGQLHEQCIYVLSPYYQFADCDNCVYTNFLTVLPATSYKQIIILHNLNRILGWKYTPSPIFVKMGLHFF